MLSREAEQSEPVIVRGSSLRNQVKRAVEDLIVYGVLEPGEHLVEGTLAERLGVSRQPVREALQTLSGTGFVELRSGRGAFVHRPTPREVREVFHVRAVLEADSAAQAAAHAEPATLSQLADIVERGTAASGNGDSRALLDLNTTFHELITEAGGNRVARRFLEDLQRRISWFLATIIKSRAPSSWTEHAAILQALRNGRQAEAAEQARLHVMRSLELMEFAV